MKIVKRCLLLLAVLFSAASVYAQTADEIIAKHIDAVGGKEKLSAITSVRMENIMQIMGTDAPSTVVVLNGKGHRTESEFNGSKVIQVYTDKGGWSVNPMMGVNDPQPMPEAQYKAGQSQIYIMPFLNYAEKGYKVELLGQEKLGNVNAFKIKLTDKDNNAATYFFDPANYYIVQVVKEGEMMGQPTTITTTLSDYKKTDYGWVVPQSIGISFGGQFSLTGKVNKVEVNVPVDAAIFEMKK